MIFLAGGNILNTRSIRLVHDIESLSRMLKIYKPTVWHGKQTLTALDSDVQVLAMLFL